MISKGESLDRFPDKQMLFLANTVHEIRTPVQTIIGTLELLSDTALNEEQTEYVRQIKFSSDVLLSLINDILDFAKIHSQQFNLESIAFDIVNLTEQVADFVSIEAFGKKLEVVTDIDYSVPRFVMGDQTRVQEILINLIKNAVKFTSSGYVHIELKRAILKNANGEKKYALLFEVIDSGIGIEENKRGKLFTDFYQTESSTTRKYGGTGLGLAICKNLVTAMHGEIGMKANPFGGSIFWFAIPLVPATNAQIARAMDKSFAKISPMHVSTNITQPEREQKEMFSVPPDTHILIVDDNALARQSMTRKLASLGLHNVQSVETAQEALLTLDYAAKMENPFKIIFIDMIMPRVDGWHLAADMNERHKLNDIKRYLLVPEGQMGREAKMRLMKWFTGYLYKPIKRDKLRTLLIETYDVPTDIEPIDAPANKIQNTNESDVLKDISVLVVEDHPMNRRLLITFLKKFGVTTYEAENGKDAIAQVAKHGEIDLILMDIQMPVLDGIEATKQLRRSQYNGIIIACTANNYEDDFAEYRSVGMNDVLVKPFKRDAVKLVIEKWYKDMQDRKASAKSESFAATASATSNETGTESIKETVAVINHAELEKSKSAKPWDIDDFEDTISHNIELGKKLIDDFMSQTNILLGDIVRHISSKEFEELRRIGHTIEGSSKTISANMLAENGKYLNAQAKLFNIDGIEKAYLLTRKSFTLFEELALKWKDSHSDLSTR